MRTITEANLLVRTRTELPEDFRLTTEEFGEGWGLARSADSRLLKKKILNRGWNFIRIGGGSLGSGVGDTSQEAIAGALKLVLRQITTYLNAVEVKHIELTRYPWFFLARVRVESYRIQQEVELSALVVAETLPSNLGHGQKLSRSVAPYPHLAKGMPQLKQMLLSSQGMEN